MKDGILKSIGIVCFVLLIFNKLWAQVETTVPLSVGTGETYASLDTGIGLIDVFYRGLHSTFVTNYYSDT